MNIALATMQFIKFWKFSLYFKLKYIHSQKCVNGETINYFWA